MLAFVGLIVAYGLAQPPSHAPIVSRLPGPSSRLQKPEPTWLLTQFGLALNTVQASAIQKTQERWQVDRTKLMEAMATYAPKEGRADQISGSLEGYSQLSRLFDSTRQSYWRAACKVLNSKQLAVVEERLR